MAGVKGVSNDITIKPTVQPYAVKDAIEKALVRNAEIDAGTVKVAADGGSVTLSGSVRSWGEKDQAGNAAWNAPGVNTVRNDIAVVTCRVTRRPDHMSQNRRGDSPPSSLRSEGELVRSGRMLRLSEGPFHIQELRRQ